MKNITLFFLVAFIYSSSTKAQQTDLDANYKSAVNYLWQNLNNKKIFNLQVNPNWFSDNSGLWYEYRTPEAKKYLKVALPSLEKSDLFDHQSLAKQLSELLEEEMDADDLPISSIEYKAPNQLVLTIKGKQYELNPKNNELQEKEAEKANNPMERASPDKNWIAFTKDYNLFIKDKEGGKERQLSTKGEKGYEYASWYGWADIMEGENGARPERFRANWSPDGKWIQANICDFRTANKMYLLDWSVDTLYRPRLLSYYRGSPGDTGMVYDIPVFFNVESGEEIRPEIPRPTHINGVNVLWSKKPGVVYLVWSTRGYQNMYVQAYDLNTEELKTLYHESSTTNIDNFGTRFDKENNQLYFLSEKSGWRQLYSLDLNTGAVTTITKGDYYVHNLKRILDKEEKIFFSAAGKEPGSNPYHQYLYSVKADGRDLKLLTKEPNHHDTNLSPDGKYFVDNFSSVDTETKTLLRDAQSGKVLLELSTAILKDMAAWQAPETFSTTARDGKTTIYGALWKPTHFDPGKKYPIIDYSYTGPHTQVYPENFRSAFFNQALAELGFIIVQVDGLGSSGRSKAFHNYSYKNLGGNLEDHVLAIRDLGKRYDWIDTTRVGIYGHSAGGYDAGHALLAYPDFYKVAVASSADHDHRMEKAWWPEMYMGWPVDEAYHEQSNITMAGNLKGKLLITHGGIDENVNPSASFKLAEALVQADKQFDMLIFPSQRHGYRGKTGTYFRKVRWNYFVKHLLGEEPIWNIKWEN